MKETFRSKTKNWFLNCICVYERDLLSWSWAAPWSSYFHLVNFWQEYLISFIFAVLCTAVSATQVMYLFWSGRPLEVFKGHLFSPGVQPYSGVCNLLPSGVECAVWALISHLHSGWNISHYVIPHNFPYVWMKGIRIWIYHTEGYTESLFSVSAPCEYTKLILLCSPCWHPRCLPPSRDFVYTFRQTSQMAAMTSEAYIGGKQIR